MFVAGHTGLIGSSVLRRLQNDGFENLITARHAELDLCKPDSVDQFLELQRPDYVILAAGKVGGIAANISSPADFISTNLAIQLNVLRAAFRAGVKKLILFGSSCMYPRDCAQPMPEAALYSGHPEPTSMAYAVAKLAGVQLCLSYNQQMGEQRFIPVIPNSTYGPNDNFDPESAHVLSGLISRFHEAKQSSAEFVTLWGDGTPRREFIHADDVADACQTLLSVDTSNLIFPMNIGSGSDVSIQELAEKVVETVGYRGRIKWDTTKPEGTPRKLLDSSRVKKLGWRPKVDLDAGLQSSYRWYVDNQTDQGVTR